MILRKWEIQFCYNPWLTLGFHFDHTDPSITLHLPGIIIMMGRCKQPGFKGGMELRRKDKKCLKLTSK